MLGAIFIISMYLYCERLKTFAFRLVFFMAISDFFTAFGGVFGDTFSNDEDSAGCYFQGIVIQLGSLSSILWTTVISHCIQEVVLKRNMNVEEYISYYQGYVYGVTIVLSFLPFTTESYGDASGWCWINRSDDAGKVWRMI
eukprot:UN32471